MAQHKHSFVLEDVTERSNIVLPEKRIKLYVFGCTGCVVTMTIAADIFHDGLGNIAPFCVRS